MKKFLLVLISVLMVFITASVTFAANVSFGGDLYFRLEDGIDDASKVDFYKFEVSTQKRFGVKGLAYLAIETHKWTNNRWQIRNYGYDYTFNSMLKGSILYDVDGITLSSGELSSNWDWLHVHAFNSKTVLNLTGRPFKGANLNFYIEPENIEYIVKGEYKTNALKVGGGYTNASALVDVDRSFNIYGELLPIRGSRVYLDYLSDEKIIVDASTTFEPITIAILYSNENKERFGYEVFTADTADLSVSYFFSSKMSLKGGLIYDFVDTEVGDVYLEYGFNRGYVGVNHHLPDAEFKLYGGYSIDGVNTLEGSYNLNSNAWMLAMAIDLW